MIVQLIDYMRQRPKGMLHLFYLVLAIIIVWGLTVDLHHAHTKVEKIPFFWAVFALIAAIVLIYFSRWLGKSGIKTREDYYDK